MSFDFLFGVGLGDGVGEAFFCFGDAVGDGLGVAFLVERFRCLRVGAGVGVGAKIFLIFVPNDSSRALAPWAVLNNIARIKSHFIIGASVPEAVVSAVLSGQSSARSLSGYALRQRTQPRAFTGEAE